MTMKSFRLFFLLAAALNLLIESLARLDPLGGIRYLADRPAQFLLNTLLLFAVFSASLLFRRRLFVLTITALGWLTLFSFRSGQLRCRALILPFSAPAFPS